MAKPTLLPDPTCLRLKIIDASEAVITVVVTPPSPEAEGPLCHRRWARPHSRYVRQVADLPWMGCAVHLDLPVRRFFGPNQECVRRIFSQRLPTVVAPYARRTMRLTDVFTRLGFALGGEAGKRLAAGMGLATSPATLLRLIHSAQEPSHATPGVLGVDDFSFRRRISFGTIRIDLEKRIPIDRVPDREVETFARWVLDHPGVEISSRDRGGDSAKGARKGAPDAKQIADRWHLLKKLSEPMPSFFLRKPPQLKAASADAKHDPAESVPPSVPWHPGRTKRQEAKSRHYHQERVERYRQIHDLAAKQVDVAPIARPLGLSGQGGYNYLQMKHPPERTRIHQGGPPLSDPSKEDLIQRWNQGWRRAQQMYREIKEQGYP